MTRCHAKLLAAFLSTTEFAKEVAMAPGIVITAFVAIVGLVALATAIRFALRPSEHGLAVLRPLSATTTYAALTASLLGITNGLTGWAHRLDSGDAATATTAWRMLPAGLAEAMVPLVLAFALLTVAWLLAAVGLRRQA